MKRRFTDSQESVGARTLVRPLPIAIVITVILASLTLWYPELFPSKNPSPSPQVTQTHPPAPPQKSPTGAVATVPLKPEELSSEPSHPLAVSFGADATLAPREAAILLEILEFYRQEFGSFPAGQENADIMNALTGNNPRKLPIFPRPHPRIDALGRLLDAWGKPFIFHPVSSQHLEVLSCGPDGEIFTTDDIRVPPPR